MQKGCNAARSDTFKRINQFTDRYLNLGTKPIICNAGTTVKMSRGLNHPQIGRLIIPAEQVAEWDEDPERYIFWFFMINLLNHTCSLKACFNSGQNTIMGYNMPIFLYHEYEYDPKDPDKGLFQSACLACVSGYMRNNHYRNTDASIKGTRWYSLWATGGRYRECQMIWVSPTSLHRWHVQCRGDHPSDDRLFSSSGMNQFLAIILLHFIHFLVYVSGSICALMQARLKLQGG